MRNQFVGAAVGATLLLAHPAIAQSSRKESVIPLRELSAPEVQTPPQFASIASVRELSTGNVMVNDDKQHQLVSLNHALENPVVVLDSAAMVNQGFAKWMAKVIPFIGDSSIFADEINQALVVMDGQGKIARKQRIQNRVDLLYLATARGADAQGNFVYPVRFSGMTEAQRNAAISQGTSPSTLARMNLNTMQPTFVGKLITESPLRTSPRFDQTGVSQMVAIVNPLAQSDDWAVLSDGSVALLYGADYHVEISQPNHRALAAITLPFVWRALSDAQKQAIVDSVVRVREAETRDPMSPISMLAVASSGYGSALPGGIVSSAPGSPFLDEVRRASSGMPTAGGRERVQHNDDTVMPGPRIVVESVPLSAMHNVYPAFFPNAAKPDLDAQLWIRTTATIPAHDSDALYDVLNNRGELVQRVHVPADRTIVGFGRGGIVYLKHLGGTQQWALERVKVMQ